jgi:hypothetical protein
MADVTPIPHPYRVVMMGAPLERWFGLTEEEKSQRFLPGFTRMLAAWEELGAEVVGSLTDDLLNVGPPATLDFVWFLLFDVMSLDVLAAMINEIRREVDGVRMDAYVRFEARVGRPFYAREEKWVDAPA